MLYDVVKAAGVTGLFALFGLIGRRVNHWLKTDWMPEDRIARAFQKHDTLLHQAERLDNIGQSDWAEETRYRAYRAAIRPIAIFETARNHSVREIMIALSVAAFVFGVGLAIVSKIVPFFTYPTFFLLAISCIGSIYGVATADRINREIRERVEKKLVSYPMDSSA